MGDKGKAPPPPPAGGPWEKRFYGLFSDVRTQADNFPSDRITEVIGQALEEVRRP